MEHRYRSYYVKCACNYKCRHTPFGEQLIKERTYHNHLRQDVLGNIHPSVIQRLQNSDTRSNTSRLRNNSAQKRWCDCSLHCGGGKMVPLSTWFRHSDTRHTCMDLARNLGFPDIYQWIKLSIQSKRKHTKRKNYLLNIEEKDASDPITSEDHIQYDGTDHLETNISSTKNQEVHFNEADDHLNDHHISYQEMIENETLSDSDIFANDLTHLEDEIDDIGLASQPSCLGVRSIRARKMSLKKLESLQNQSLKNIRRENKRTKSSFDFGSSLTTKSMFQNQSMVDAVENLATADLETILMKFFSMDLVDELYSNLKCSYKIVLAMSKKDFRRRIHVNELDGDTMKEEMVKILLEEEHIALRPTLNGHIELDDVIRLK